MNRSPYRKTSLLATLWQTEALLTAVGCLMLAALGLALAGLWLDPRTILGAPAWLKPAKFAASTAVYAFTLAWLFTYLPAWPRTRRGAAATTAIVFIAEVGIVSLQAWRGTTSHFNVRTTFDALLFTTMGLAIVVQTASGVAVAAALWRQRFQDRAMAWALRLGLTISLIGSASGGLMTAPTQEQLAEARTSGATRVAGAHTVGAPDGGPGVTGTGWSVTHGDLRVPHFLGLHAMQMLPLLVVLLRGRVAPDSLVRLTVAAAAVHFSLFCILLWQALRGESVVHPGDGTTAALVAWSLVSAVGVACATNRCSTAGLTPQRSEVPHVR